MNTFEAIEILNKAIKGELRTAWEFYMKNKPQEAGGGLSLNASGCFIPDPWQSALQAVSFLNTEQAQYLDREKKVNEILFKYIEMIERDY